MQIDRGLWVLELFHGPTLAFKDVAMQLLARLMDRVLAARGERVTDRGARPPATPAAPPSRRSAAPSASMPSCCSRTGASRDVQRRMMTTAAEPNVHAVAIEGTFDDCQALVKAMFNDLAFRDRLRLAAVNSINWARIVAQITYYFVAAAALGGPHRRVLFSVPTGNFGDVFAGYAAKAMGLPVERLVIATNENDILAPRLEHGHLRAARRGGDHIAVDGYPGLLQLRALPVRGRRPRCGLRARQDGRTAAKPLHRSRRGRACPTARAFIAERVDQAAVADCIRRVKARKRLSARPSQRLRGGGGAQDADAPTQHVPTSRSPPPIRRSFPMPSRRSPANGRLCRPGWPRCMTEPERMTVCPTISAPSQRFVERRADAGKETAA